MLYSYYNVMTGYEKRDHFAQNAIFLAFFKLSPFQGFKSPRLRTWFLSSLDLPLHRSNVKSYSKPPVPSAEPPKRGIKLWFSNAIDVRDRPGSGRGSEFLASVARWWKNIHTRFEVHSCYSSRDISVLKRKFGKCVKWSFLISILYSNSALPRCALIRRDVRYLETKYWISVQTHG